MAFVFLLLVPIPRIAKCLHNHRREGDGMTLPQP